MGFAGEDDHGDTRGQATPVGPNSATRGRLERAGDLDYFRVQVAESGRLTTETSGSADTTGYLYDASGRRLAGNANSGAGGNFRISLRVAAGTYYVRVSGHAGRSTGAYVLSVGFRDGG